LFSPIIVIFKSYEDKSVYYKIEVRMPYCNICSKGKKIEPEYVDFEENHLAFIVHDNLKKEFNKNKKYINYKDIKR